MSTVSAFTLTAFLMLGVSSERMPCPKRIARTVRPLPAHVMAPATPRAPTAASSWLDYIDLRPGSGDVLAELGCRTLSAELAEPRHPSPDT